MRGNTEHTNSKNFSAAQSRVYSLPCAQMSFKSFRLVRQLPGDQQEAVRAYKHTLAHGLCVDQSCLKHDTSEDAEPTSRECETPWDLLFLLFNIIACMKQYFLVICLSLTLPAEATKIQAEI